MRIELNKLKKLPVLTKSEHPLGRIVNAEINLEQNTIDKYYVVRKRFFAKSPVLLIAPDQIISINESRIIVQDAVEGDQIELLGEPTSSTKKQSLKINNPAPIQAKSQN